jgi:hypothetical protein
MVQVLRSAFQKHRVILVLPSPRWPKVPANEQIWNDFEIHSLQPPTLLAFFSSKNV